MYLAKLTDGQKVVVSAEGGWQKLTVITGAGAVATVSRVDSNNVTDHTPGATNQFAVAAATRIITDVDWPHYLVSVAGGDCRVGLI
jgi:hypothetical protein